MRVLTRNLPMQSAAALFFRLFGWPTSNGAGDIALAVDVKSFCVIQFNRDRSIRLAWKTALSLVWNLQ